MVLVSYDVAVSSPGGKTRLRQVARECQNFGQRVQYSVFECIVDPAQWTKLKNKLESVIDKEQDSLRYYFLGANYKKKVEHVGAKGTLDIEGPIIV